MSPGHTKIIKNHDQAGFMDLSQEYKIVLIFENPCISPLLKTQKNLNHIVILIFKEKAFDKIDNLLGIKTPINKGLA